jgi:hypothetical protein
LLILFYYTILMISKIVALILGVVICVIYGVNIQKRKTIVLNSSRMKKLNNNIIKVDNRCFRIDKKTNKCEKKN